MHTSTRMLVARLSRAVPQRSLPPCGGGTGRGVQRALPLSCINGPTKCEPAVGLKSFLCGISFALGALSPPPSLSLPRKGGGNRVARTFVTHANVLAAHIRDVCMP